MAADRRRVGAYNCEVGVCAERPPDVVHWRTESGLFVVQIEAEMKYNLTATPPCKPEDMPDKK